MGPSCARSNGARKPSGSSAVTRQYHHTRCGARGPPRPGPCCVRRYALSCDATLVSALTRHGQPAHTVDSQHGAQATGLDDLLCPLCRHSACPRCIRGGWTGRQDAELGQLCVQHDVPIPARLSGESTVRQVVPDYAARKFTDNDEPEPRPPPRVAVLCRRRCTGHWQRQVMPGAAKTSLDATAVPQQAGDPCRHCGTTQVWTFDRLTRGGE